MAGPYLLFTRRCEFCGKTVDGAVRVCGECKGSVIPISGDHCVCCGLPKKRCRCGKGHHFYDDVTAPYIYVGGAKALIRRYKFSPDPDCAKTIAHGIARGFSACYSPADVDMIMSVPQTANELSSRGFDQAELLGRICSVILDVPYHGLLKKLYDTDSQRNVAGSERAGNVFGVFDILAGHSKHVEGKNVLLVDDVKTTGATVDECSKMLKLYNCNKVIVSVFAVDEPEGRKENNNG